MTAECSDGEIMAYPNQLFLAALPAGFDNGIMCLPCSFISASGENSISVKTQLRSARAQLHSASSPPTAIPHHPRLEITLFMPLGPGASRMPQSFSVNSSFGRYASVIRPLTLLTSLQTGWSCFHQIHYLSPRFFPFVADIFVGSVFLPCLIHALTSDGRFFDGNGFLLSRKLALDSTKTVFCIASTQDGPRSLATHWL